MVAQEKDNTKYIGYLEPFIYEPPTPQTIETWCTHWWAHEYRVAGRRFDIRFDRDATRMETLTYMPVRVTVIERYVGKVEIPGLPDAVRWYEEDDPKLDGMWNRILCPIDRYVSRTKPD